MTTACTSCTARLSPRISINGCSSRRPIADEPAQTAIVPTRSTHLRPIQVHYFASLNACTAARYDLRRVYRAWAQQRFERELAPIRDRISALLAPPTDG